jgi:hypothetical protein
VYDCVVIAEARTLYDPAPTLNAIVKSITGVPPFDNPWAHDRPIYDPVVISGLLARFVGASGTV